MTYEYRFFGLFRLVLAGLVVLHHFAANAAPEAVTLALQRYEVGSVAVLVFFSLSGFVIMEAADIAYRGRPLAFIANRWLRVFPHFAVSLLVNMLLQAALLAAGLLRVEPDLLRSGKMFAVKNVLLNVVSIVPFVDHLIPHNFLSIAWAVRVEMAFYVVVMCCLLAGQGVRRFGRISLECAVTGALVFFVPVFLLSLQGNAPKMFGLFPYFAYGGSLYFAIKRKRAGVVAAFLSFCLIAVHCASGPATHAVLGFRRAIVGQACLLAVLLGGMTVLPFLSVPGFKKLDRALGNLTYPLYMHHAAVLLAVSSLVPAPGYCSFAVGLAASIAYAWLMSLAVDPFVDGLRGRIRGMGLRPNG